MHVVEHIIDKRGTTLNPKTESLNRDDPQNYPGKLVGLLVILIYSNSETREREV